MAGRGTRAGAGGFALRQLWRAINERTQGTGTQSRPLSDPQFKAGHTVQSFAHQASILSGIITDVVAPAACYRVQLEKGHAPITAVLGTQGSYFAFGARPLTTLQPGTSVYVIVHPQKYYGVIIAAVPPPQTDPTRSLAQQLCQSSRNRVDDAHFLPMRLTDGGDVTDWNAGRPFDATQVGEQGFISETGTRVFVDPFMAQLAVDEACGVFAFYHDQLLRLAGYNLRMFTAGSEREALDDQGEYNDVTGFTPYPWEQLGQVTSGDSARDMDAEAWQLGQPHYGNLEPQNDDARPWHREVEFHGYLGQGGKRTIYGKPDATQIRYGQQQPVFPGLYDHTVALTGHTSWSTAKGFSLVKRAAIVAPARKYVPEQIKDEGDSPTNYKAAGLTGDGESHTITGDIQTSGQHPQLSKAAGILDLHAYLFNYANIHPFFWHAKDWATPDEDALDHLGGGAVTVPNFGQLNGGQYLSSEDVKETVEIDHRYGSTSIYRNSCGVEGLDDGGLILFDGFGGEDRMTAGSRFISAPGDIWIKAGRNINLWAGNDIILRAKNSIDVSSTEKDVRVKAEKNMHLLSGNSGQGGTLIESRGQDTFQFEGKTGEDVQSGGVMLRSTKGSIVGWATSIYLRTGGGDIQPGPIVLDAAKGESPVVTYGSAIEHYVEQSFLIHFNSQSEGESAEISPQATSLPGNLFMNGRGIFAEDVLSGGNLFAAGGHVLTSDGCNTTEVGCLNGEALAKVQEALGLTSQQVAQTLPAHGREFYESTLTERYYAENKPGNDTVIQTAEFSYRSTSQYGTDTFALYEDRWQQMARLSGKGGVPWTEKPVASRQDPLTYPYPGRSHFIGGSSYYKQDLTLFDAATGRSQARGEQGSLQGPYTSPQYGSPQPASLDSYTVIK